MAAPGDGQLLGGEPVRGKFVEGRVNALRWRRLRPWRSPGAEVDVAQHNGKLPFRHLGRPAVLGAAELDHPALAVGAEPQREAASAPRRLEHLSVRPGGHQLSPGADIEWSMKARFAHDAPGR